MLARRVSFANRWQVPPRLDRWLSRLPFALLGLVFVSVGLGLGLDLNAMEPFDAYIFQVAGTASIVLAVVGLVASLFQPLAYCKYGCPTGALFKMLRFTGTGDRLGLRDWLAAALLGIVAVLA